VVVLSITEGEHKPLKYPDMFAAADLTLLNESDLLRIWSSTSTPVSRRHCGQSPDSDPDRLSPHREGLAAFYAWIESHAPVASDVAAVPALAG